MFELSIATAWTKNFMITWIFFFNLQQESIEIFSEKLTVFFFTTPSFNEKLLFFIFLVYAVKNSLLIVKNFDFLF